MAYSSEIYVYVPQFGTQALPRKPALVVPSQPSRAGLEGYLDHTNPHSINNLVVQFLGDEEVVAAVRDDGAPLVPRSWTRYVILRFCDAVSDTSEDMLAPEQAADRQLLLQKVLKSS